MGLDLSKAGAYFTEDSLSVFGIGLNHFSNEKDCLQGGKSRFTLESEEILHERAEHVRDGLRVGLGDLVDRLNQQVSILIRDCSLRPVLLHLAGSHDFTIDKRNDFFEVALAD